MFWSYPLPALDPGAHLIEFMVWSDKKLTDGLDENGDGQLDTYGPGDILTGYVEVVVHAVASKTRAPGKVRVPGHFRLSAYSAQPRLAQ